MRIPQSQIVPYSEEDLRAFIRDRKAVDVMRFFGAIDLHEMRPLNHDTYISYDALGNEIDLLFFSLFRENSPSRYGLEISPQLDERRLRTELEENENYLAISFNPIAWVGQGISFNPGSKVVFNDPSIFRVDKKGNPNYVGLSDVDPNSDWARENPNYANLGTELNKSIDFYFYQLVNKRTASDNTLARLEEPRVPSPSSLWMEDEFRQLWKFLNSSKMLDWAFMSEFEKRHGLNHERIGEAIYYINQAGDARIGTKNNPYYNFSLGEITPEIDNRIKKFYSRIRETAREQFGGGEIASCQYLSSPLTELLRSAKYINMAARIDQNLVLKDFSQVYEGIRRLHEIAKSRS